MNTAQSFDREGFRRALGQFVTGVTIVTTLCKNGSKQGITANSFNSVSLDPPLVLVSVARSLGCFDHFAGCEHFAVNVLRADQKELSNRFASRGVDKWAGIDHHIGIGGVPLIDAPLATFECRANARYEGGDHIILVGEVLRFEMEPEQTPLVYFRGRYDTVAA